jgi:hypothetical protein
VLPLSRLGLHDSSTPNDITQAVFWGTYRYCLGPYRKHRGHAERSRERNWPMRPRWFRYGAMKEASSVWHEAAMGFDSTMAGRERVGRDIGRLKVRKDASSRV